MKNEKFLRGGVLEHPTLCRTKYSQRGNDYQTIVANTRDADSFRRWDQQINTRSKKTPSKYNCHHHHHHHHSHHHRHRRHRHSHSHRHRRHHHHFIIIIIIIII